MLVILRYVLTKNTSYIFMGKLLSVYYEYFEEKIPWYKGVLTVPVSQVINIHQGRSMLCHFGQQKPH